MGFKMFKLFKLLLLLNLLNYSTTFAEESGDSSSDYELIEMREESEIQSEFFSNSSETSTTNTDSTSNVESSAENDNPVLRSGSLHDVLAHEIGSLTETERGGTVAPILNPEATASPALGPKESITQAAGTNNNVSLDLLPTEPNLNPSLTPESPLKSGVNPLLEVVTKAPLITPTPPPETPIKTASPPPRKDNPRKGKQPQILDEATEAPPKSSPTIEHDKPDNITYKMDLDKFVTNVDTMLDVLYHFLAKMRNYSPIRNEFKELIDVFYVVLMPLMSHEDANMECLRRGARMYEISTQKRLDSLNQMSYKHLPINASAESGQAIKIWLDVVQDPDGTLSFQSGDPILTFIYKQPVELESGLPEGHCLYFDWDSNKYVKALCSEEHLTICSIEKTTKVMEEKIFVENINDRIRDVISLKLRKNMKTYLETQLDKLESGDCPVAHVSSLTNALGLDQPVESLRLKGSLDVQSYNMLIQYLRQDIINFKNLFLYNDFEGQIKEALGLAREIKAFYDKGKKAICLFQKVLTPDNQPKALETWISEIESKVNLTINSTAHISKRQLEQALREVQESFAKIKLEKVSHDRVTNLIDEAFKKIDQVSSNPNSSTAGLVSQVMNKVRNFLDEYKKGRENFESEFNTTTNGTSVGVDESTFYKFSLLDIILASTSVVLATIAVVNSIYLCRISPNIDNDEVMNDIMSLNDIEITPYRNRKLEFGPSNVQEYSIGSSVDTMPSPEPDLKRGRPK